MRNVDIASFALKEQGKGKVGVSRQSVREDEREVFDCIPVKDSDLDAQYHHGSGPDDVHVYVFGVYVAAP